MTKINWLKANCPVCRREYEYPEGGYKPKTCASFDCVHKYHHNPERYESLQSNLDLCRKIAGV